MLLSSLFSQKDPGNPISRLQVSIYWYPWYCFLNNQFKIYTTVLPYVGELDLLQDETNNLMKHDMRGNFCVKHSN